jgi:DNA-binding transcriptional regulator YiaG
MGPGAETRREEETMKTEAQKALEEKDRNGAWLKRSRRALGLSQNALAGRLRLTGGSRSIRKYELGERPLSGPVTVAVEGFLKEAVDGG